MKLANLNPRYSIYYYDDMEKQAFLMPALNFARNLLPKATSFVSNTFQRAKNWGSNLFRNPATKNTVTVTTELKGQNIANAAKKMEDDIIDAEIIKEPSTAMTVYKPQSTAMTKYNPQNAYQSYTNQTAKGTSLIPTEQPKPQNNWLNTFNKFYNHPVTKVGLTGLAAYGAYSGMRNMFSNNYQPQGY